MRYVAGSSFFCKPPGLILRFTSTSVTDEWAGDGGRRSEGARGARAGFPGSIFGPGATATWAVSRSNGGRPLRHHPSELLGRARLRAVRSGRLGRRRSGSTSFERRAARHASHMASRRWRRCVSKRGTSPASSSITATPLTIWDSPGWPGPPKPSSAGNWPRGRCWRRVSGRRWSASSASSRESACAGARSCSRPRTRSRATVEATSPRSPGRRRSGNSSPWPLCRRPRAAGEEIVCAFPLKDEWARARITSPVFLDPKGERLRA